MTIDRRRRTFQTQHTEMLTKDKECCTGVLCDLVGFRSIKVLSIDCDIETADDKLNGLITNAKIGVLGKYELSALASTDTTLLKAKIEADCLRKHKPSPVNNTVSKFSTLDSVDCHCQRKHPCGVPANAGRKESLLFAPKGKRKPVVYEPRPILRWRLLR